MNDTTPVVRVAGPAQLNPTRHVERRKRLERFLSVLFPLLLLVILQIGAVQGWWDRRFTPAPTDVGRRLIGLFRDKGMSTDLLVTLRRVSLGYMIGVVSGASAGFIMGMSRLVRRTIQPTFAALYTVPKITLLSPFLIIFGFNEKPIIFLIATTVFFFVWVQTQSAVLAVHKNFLEAGQVFGANKVQQLIHVIIPASLPQMFTSFRIAANVALLSVVGIEIAFSPQNRGLGYVINYARMTLDADIAWAGILVVSVMGVLLSSALRRLSRLLVKGVAEDALD